MQNKEIQRLNGIYNGILTRAGVEILRGKASFVDSHTVASRRRGHQDLHRQDDPDCRGRLAVCARVPGKELGITSNEAFYLPELPKRALIVGGTLRWSLPLFSRYGSRCRSCTAAKSGCAVDEDLRDHLKTEYDARGSACGSTPT